MKLISDRVLAHYIKAAEYTAKKCEDHLMTKVVPVDARVAIEIGMDIPSRAKQLLAESVENPEAKVLAKVRLVDYVQALKAYRDGSVVPPDFETPSPQGSKFYDDAIKKRFEQLKAAEDREVRPDQPEADDGPSDESTGP